MRASSRSSSSRARRSPPRDRPSRSSSNASIPAKASRSSAARDRPSRPVGRTSSEGSSSRPASPRRTRAASRSTSTASAASCRSARSTSTASRTPAVYVNQKFKAIVTEANQREKNLVVSRRELLEQERAEQREKTWKTLEEGQVREGVVRSVKDFGAFVDLGGVDGLLPIGEMSWSRVDKADDLVRSATR